MNAQAKKCLNVARALFTPLCIAFALYLAWDYRDQLVSLFSAVRLDRLLLSLLLWSSINFLAPLSAFVLLRRTNEWLKAGVVLDIHISRLPARYLPGGVWHTVARFTDYHVGGANPKSLKQLFAIESFVPPLVALSLGASIVLSMGRAGGWWQLLTACGFTAILLLIIFPFLLTIVPERVVGRLVRHDYLLAVMVMVIFWLGAASSFVFYLSGFDGFLLADGPAHIAGAYMVSWGVGYLAVFAPQGIGVFEVVAGNLIELPLELGGAAIILAGFRILVFTADMMNWAAYTALVAVRRRTAS